MGYMIDDVMLPVLHAWRKFRYPSTFLLYLGRFCHHQHVVNCMLQSATLDDTHWEILKVWKLEYVKGTELREFSESYGKTVAV